MDTHGLLISLVAATSVGACAAAVPGHPGQSGSQGDTASSARASLASGGTTFEVRMRRSGCYGRCPSYTVSINGDGVVEFTGERFTAATGVQRGQAPAAALQGLRALLAEPAVAALSGAYTPGDPKRCGVWATDFASVAIELRIDGRSRRIEHYLGCQSAPAALVQLEQAIDTAGGTEQWIEGGATE